MKTATACCLILGLIALQQAYFGNCDNNEKPLPIEKVKQYIPLIEKCYNKYSKDENYGLVAKIESANGLKTKGNPGQILDITYTLHVTDCKKQEVLKGLKASNSCKQMKVSSGP